MCIALKYGIWNTADPEPGAVNALVGSGYAPLAAMILASRGKISASAAEEYLRCDTPLLDPFLMKDMDIAAGRVGLAMSRGERLPFSVTMMWTVLPPPVC